MFIRSYLALGDKERRGSFEFVCEKPVLDKKAKVTTLRWPARTDRKKATVSNASNFDQLSNIKDMSPFRIPKKGMPEVRHLHKFVPVSDGKSLQGAGKVRGPASL